jgi:hypothetical protein
MSKLIYWCFFTVCLIPELFSQEKLRFSGGLHSGLNMAQIDGDGISGFRQLGFNGGVFGQARLKRNMAFGVEFNYSQRGSHYGKNDIDLVVIRLNYIEVPVMFIIKDWKVEVNQREYERMHFMGGLSFGRLISASSLTGIHEEFNKNDLSWLAGFSYYYSYHWGIKLRYTRSFTPLRRAIINNAEVPMISYFLSLGLVYQFNP